MTYQCHACGREQATRTADRRCPRAYCGGTLFLVELEPVRKPLKREWPPEERRVGRPSRAERERRQAAWAELERAWAAYERQVQS